MVPLRRAVGAQILVIWEKQVKIFFFLFFFFGRLCFHMFCPRSLCMYAMSRFVMVW